ncbi:MAG: phosphate ABC transporter substrate-binding protein PstS, partial [Nitrosomonadales bacterium]
WAYTSGDTMALDLDYIPMPDNVVKLIQNSWKSNIKGADGKAIY